MRFKTWFLKEEGPSATSIIHGSFDDRNRTNEYPLKSRWVATNDPTPKYKNVDNREKPPEADVRFGMEPKDKERIAKKTLEPPTYAKAATTRRPPLPLI